MADENEKPNSQTGEDEVDDQDLDLNDIGIDDEDDEEDIETVKGKNKQLFVRLMKAEGKVKDPETGKWVKQAPKEEPAAPAPKPKQKPEKVTPPENVTLTEDDVDARLEAKLFKRDLDSLDVSEEIRGEIKKYAQANNLSVTQAAASKFINFLQGEEAAKKKVEDASISRKQKSFAKADFADASPSDFDLSTPEGRDQWKEYKAWLKDQ